MSKLRADWGDGSAVFYARVYLAWGEKARALEALEIALRVRDPYLINLKSWFAPLRAESRFQAIEKALNFPD